MNNAERKQLLRVEECLRIPEFLDVNRTPTFESYISYAREARDMIEGALIVMTILRLGEAWEDQLEEELGKLEAKHREWRTKTNV